MTGSPSDAAWELTPPERPRRTFSLPGVDGIPSLDDLSGNQSIRDPYETAQVMTPPPAVVDDPSTSAAGTEPADPSTATDTLSAAPSPFERPLPRFIAIANQKGGVGKTTTAVNLGACLAELGYRVLVVDLDPQGNASTGLGINIRDLQASMYDVMLNDLPIEDCVEATAVRNLFVAPAALDLAGAEIELVPAFSREMRLRRALDIIRDDYDFVFVDCPPSLGLLTLNALVAADAVLIPLTCEYFALEGLADLVATLRRVRGSFNPSLDIAGVLLTMYDERTNLGQQVARDIREFFQDRVYQTVIPRNVRLGEAPSHGMPVIFR